MNSRLHGLLKKQYARFFKDRGGPFLWRFRSFLKAVNEAYHQDEQDRKNLEHTLDLRGQEIARRNTHLQAIFQTFPDLFLVINEQEEIVEFSGASFDDNAESGRWIGRPLESFPNPDVGRRFRDSLRQARAARAPTTLEYALLAGASLGFYEARLRPMDDGQAIILIRDITGRKAALEALKASEERYALAARAANDGLWDWNLPNNRIYFSPRWKALLGYSDAELGNAPSVWLDRVHPDDVEMVKRTLSETGQPGKDSLEIEYRIRHRDNTYHWALTRGLVVRDDAGAAYRLVGSQTDITTRKSAEEQLRHEAFHDKVTGLANRALFLDRLTNTLDRVKRQPGYLFAVLYVDLDRFSTINERAGHEAADRLLQAVAARLRSYARVGDTVVRLGDDEFAVLLDGIANERSAVVFADRMRELIGAPCDIGPEVVSVGASLGIALNGPESVNAEMLLNEAESAMQRAKKNGKNRHEIFDRETHSRLVSKLKIESDLRQAAERGELELYYQPIFSLKDAEIIRVEALIRWNHPRRGQVSPVEFIPVAEETGLILNIGDWVLQEVADQTRRWHAEGFAPIAVAVNFSPKQFQQQNLLTTVGTILSRCKHTGFPLEIEITESAAMQDVDETIKILKNLREMGVRISMDDFGVGYSSLSCLRLFPLNTLKIDRGFVQGIPALKDNTAITNAIIGIGHSLGLSLVAEGVENEEQLNFLKSQGVEEGQGFLLGKPMPARDLAPLLRRNGKPA